MGYAFDPSGNVVNRIQYNNSTNPVATSQIFQAYGQLLEPSNTALADPIGYKGQSGCYTDTEIAAPYTLVYCHNRYYSTYLGRWLSRDPSGAEGGINVYEFCGNNPLMYTDPSGLLYMPIANGGEGIAGDSTVNYDGHWLAASQWVDNNIFQGSAASTGDCYGRFAAGTASGAASFGNSLWLGGKVALAATGAEEGGALVLDLLGDSAVTAAEESAESAVNSGGQGALNAAETRLANMARGRAAHAEWQARLEAEGWDTEVSIGEFGRVDAVKASPESDVGLYAELKKNNPREIAKGYNQLERYPFGLTEKYPWVKTWYGSLDTYD